MAREERERQEQERSEKEDCTWKLAEVKTAECEGSSEEEEA